MGTITSTGYQRTSRTEVRRQITEDVYQANYGSNFLVDPATPQGGQIQAFIDILNLIEDDKVVLSNKFNLDLAIGTDLDALGAIIGIKRGKGTPSTLVAEITSNSTGFTITAGTRFNKLDQPDTLYQTTENVLITTIPQNVQLTAVSNIADDVQAGDSFESVNPLTEVNNISVSSYISGITVQTDVEYLLAIKERRSGAFRQSGNERISKALFENVSGLLDAKVFTVSGEVNVVTLGGANEDIAEVILDTLDAGVDTAGAESEIVNDFQGLPVTINFDNATPIELGLLFQYKRKGVDDLTQAQKDDIEAKFIEFLSNKKINEAVATSDFFNIVVPLYGETIYITNVKFIDSNDDEFNFVEAGLKEYIRADVNDITIQEEV